MWLVGACKGLWEGRSSPCRRSLKQRTAVESIRDVMKRILCAVRDWSLCVSSSCR